MLNSRIFLTISLALALAAPSSGAPAEVLGKVRNFCSATLLRLTPAKNTKNKTPAKASIEPDVYLGQGYSAQVFISRDEANPERKIVKKIYKSNEFGDRRYHLDVEGLQALYDLSKDNPGMFHVALGERFVQRGDVMEDGFRLAVRLPYIEGQTLHKIIWDNETTPERKRHLIGIFTAKLALLKMALEKSGRLEGEVELRPEEDRYFFEGEAGPLLMLKATLKEAREILIKSDNIIVDAQNPETMTIIDPY